MMAIFPSIKRSQHLIISLLLISISTLSLASTTQHPITQELYQYLEAKMIEDLSLGRQSYHFNLQITVTTAGDTDTIRTTKSPDSLIKRKMNLLRQTLKPWFKTKQKPLNIDDIQVNIHFKEPFAKLMDAWRFNLRAHAYKFLVRQGYNPLLIKIFISPSVAAEAIENNKFVLIRPVSKWYGFVLQHFFSLISAIVLGTMLFLWLFYRTYNSQKNNKHKTQAKTINVNDNHNKLKTKQAEQGVQQHNLFGTVVKNYADNYDDIDLDIVPPETKDKENLENEEILQQLLNISQVMSQLILKESIENPDFLSRLDDHWFSSNQKSEKHHREFNLAKRAALYKIVGKQNLINSLSHLRQHDLIEIVRIATEMENDLDYKNEIYCYVVDDIKFLESQPKKTDILNHPFGFLLTMQNNLIVSLLRNKKQHIQAITLAQFEHNRCEELCDQLFDETEMNHIRMEIDYYSIIKNHHFQDVASYLAIATMQLIFKELTVPLDDNTVDNNPKPAADSQRAFDDQMRQQNLSFSHSQVNWTEELVITDDESETIDTFTFVDMENNENDSVKSAPPDDTNQDKKNNWFDFGGPNASKSD